VNGAPAGRLWLLPLAALALYCLTLLTGPGQLNGDTSWLITVVEKLRAGQRAYIDVMEPNPPMAFLVYWPAAALAGMAGWSAETIVFAQCGLLALLAAALVHRIVRLHLGFSGAEATLLSAVALVALLLLPNRSFTQREHIALAALLPVAFMLAARSEGARPGLALALACGALAGLGASIKPYFVLVVALPALVAAMARRDWRVVFSTEVVAAAALFLAYAAFWLLRYPAFFGDVWFVTVNSYRLYAFGVLDYFRALPAVVMLAVLAGAALILTRTAGRPAALALAAALVAFALAFIEQGKGFAYHLYPVAGLSLILAAFAAQLREPDGQPLLPSVTALLCALVVSGAGAVSARLSAEYPDSAELQRAITAVKPKPALIVMGFDIAVNFPLARNLGATWASRLQSTWISNSAGHALKRGLSPEQRARTERAVALETGWMIEDVEKNRPDVIVFDTTSALDHIRNDPRFKAAFDGRYAPAGTAQGGRFEIFRRTGV
jgi:hypothetical protein